MSVESVDVWIDRPERDGAGTRAPCACMRPAAQQRGSMVPCHTRSKDACDLGKASKQALGREERRESRQLRSCDKQLAADDDEKWREDQSRRSRSLRRARVLPSCFASMFFALRLGPSLPKCVINGVNLCKLPEPLIDPSVRPPAPNTPTHTGRPKVAALALLLHAPAALEWPSSSSSPSSPCAASCSAPPVRFFRTDCGHAPAPRL